MSTDCWNELANKPTNRYRDYEDYKMQQELKKKEEHNNFEKEVIELSKFLDEKLPDWIKPYLGDLLALSRSILDGMLSTYKPGQFNLSVYYRNNPKGLKFATFKGWNDKPTDELLYSFKFL